MVPLKLACTAAKMTFLPVGKFHDHYLDLGTMPNRFFGASTGRKARTSEFHFIAPR